MAIKLSAHRVSGVLLGFAEEELRVDDRTGGSIVGTNLKGEVVARLPGNPGGHGTTVTESGDVFIAQLSGMVQKFVKH